MVFGTLTIVVPGSATAESFGIPPPPTCSPQIGFVTSNSTNSTNATIHFEPIVNPGCPGTIYVTLTWWNSTSYPFVALNEVKTSAFVQYSVYLDYLDPSGTYTYQLHGNGTGLTADTYDGDWETGSSTATSIQGFVTDPNNGVGTNLFVTASCIRGGLSWSNSGATNSKGYFTISTLSLGGYNPCSNGGYRVSVENWPNIINIEDGGYSGTWTQHWNETITTFAPSEMYFVLENASKSFFPITVQFVNTPYATVTVRTDSSWSTTTSVTLPWSSFASSATASWSNTYPGTWGANKELQGWYWTTGDFVLNATAGRTGWVPWSGPYGPVLSIDPTHNFDPTDWATINQFHGNSIRNFSLADTLGQQYVYGNVTASTSMTWSLGTTISVGLSIALPGVGSIGASANVGSYLTTSASSSLEVSYELEDLNAPEVCIAVAAQFGTSYLNGMVVHIWQNSLSACGE